MFTGVHHDDSVESYKLERVVAHGVWSPGDPTHSETVVTWILYPARPSEDAASPVT